MKIRVHSFLFSFLFLCFSTPLFSQKTDSKNSDKPKLIVGIVVDQMRWDFLYRYSDRYGEDGFKRLLREGFSAENAYIDYVPTYTAIGHTTLYTGSVPSIHGIAGNDFIDQRTGQSVYCTEDGQVSTVGSGSKAGQMSPRNLLTTTITDELKLATNFRSKVIGVAIKDRGSILPAGHLGDAAYWYDGKEGKWITSTWYAKELPAWVQSFNNQKRYEHYLNQENGWQTLYPIDTYLQSTEDNVPYEGKFAGMQDPVFPINTQKLLEEQGPGIITSTPFGNTFTFDMAKEALKNEALGQGPATDFLALSLSTPDYIGHQFGPNSIEVEDNYLRLDKDLGDFLSYLDQTIGKGEYTVFLSADHGVAHNSAFMQDHGIPAGAFDVGGKFKEEVNALLAKEFGHEKLVLSLTNYQVHFNNNLIEAEGLNLEALKQRAIQYFKKQEGVNYVVDMEKAASAAIPALIRERIVNGYNYKRSGAIQLILEPAWYGSSTARPTGTTHGTWNPHDSHIPLLFMGWGINPGKTNRTVHMSDVASTIAALLQIQEPNGNIGQPVVEALEKKN